MSGKKEAAGNERVDMRTWFNSDHISAMDLATEQAGKYTSTTVTIERIIPPSMVQCGPKKEMLPQAQFKGKKKKMLLRESHMKSLIRLFGFNVERMAGKRVELYVEAHVQAFGKDFDCIRFRAASGNGRSLIPDHPGPRKSKPEKDLQEPSEAPVEGDYTDELSVEEEADLAAAVRDEQHQEQQEIPE